MTEWFGIIEILDVNTRQDASSTVQLTTLNNNHVRFVHYPDCQQLIIWLPVPGREYKNLRLRQTSSNVILLEKPVSDFLNGSIQLLWDTLTIQPGDYVIEIDWNNGAQHIISFVKREEKYTEVKNEPEPVIACDKKDLPAIVYRDGFGNEIKNEDLALRDKLMKDVSDRFGRRIEYEGNFRAGTIIYVEGNLRIRFSHEMGGGNCMFYIDVPADEHWETQTNTALTRRTDILGFVANTVKMEQAPSCRFEITGECITFYYR